MEINLKNPFYAYLFGLIQTDGHLYQNTRNRGRLSIELNERDEVILLEIQKLLPFYSSIRKRTRTTNFGTNTFVSLNVSDKQFRDILEAWGLPSGKKSKIIKPPLEKFSKVDYFRGLIDGDGSLGLTANGFPFLSLITASPLIVEKYLKFIQQITGKAKTSKPNVRDKVSNIAVYKEDAQLVVKKLYYENCLAIPRKLAKANEVLAWKRPLTMKKIENRKRWTIEEDLFIQQNLIENSMKVLNRSQNSIEMRLWRLRQLVTN